MVEAPSLTWLHRYSVVTALATLVLICIGGLVTSKGVGMAVPDWPTTYGYNMFFFPISKWVGGIFHEHLHRLVASGVGLLTVILAVWIQVAAARTGLPALRRLARLGWLALFIVLLQGLLGGLRVVLNSHSILSAPAGVLFGLFHAATAQGFLAILASIALFTSKAWSRWQAQPLGHAVRNLTGKAGWIVVLLAIQLLVAATMRHQHAGLAIPDFPLAYGRLYPPTHPEFLHSINQHKTDVLDDAPVTAFQIHLHMAHRILALAIVAHVAALGIRLVRSGGGASVWGWTWMSVVGVQVILGMATIWTRKSADIATAHVAGGAVSLICGVLLTLASRRWVVVPRQVAACVPGGGIVQACAAAPLPRG